MINENEKKLYDILGLLEINYIRHEHEAVYTVEEANKLDICIPGQHCKNLFYEIEKVMFAILQF
jgi:Ala-tRNA(Pro) deacylase